MTVWLLVWTMLGSHQSFTVSNIATEVECRKLGNQLSKKVNSSFECIQYKVASRGEDEKSSSPAFKR